jgi:hypothetical protein
MRSWDVVQVTVSELVGPAGAASVVMDSRASSLWDVSSAVRFVIAVESAASTPLVEEQAQKFKRAAAANAGVLDRTPHHRATTTAVGIKDLATLGAGYQINPVKDLRPVCPNCHAMLHLARSAMPIEVLRRQLRRRPTPG